MEVIWGYKGRPLSTPLVPPVTPERGVEGDGGRHPVNSSAWRAGWHLDGGFLYYSSERRCLTSI